MGGKHPNYYSAHALFLKIIFLPSFSGFAGNNSYQDFFQGKTRKTPTCGFIPCREKISKKIPQHLTESARSHNAGSY
jgi:hypothetical protein